MMNIWGRLAAAGAIVAVLPLTAAAQTVISANDNKLTLEDGVSKVVAKPAADSVTVMKFAEGRLQVLGQVAVPTSLVGPPTSVAINRDETLALVTASMKIGADGTRQVPDNKVSVIDLTASPPKLVQTVEAGAGASGVSFTPEGHLALVADRSAGTVSVFKVEGRSLAKIDTVAIGKPDVGVSHVAVTPDGRWALVTRDGDSVISVLKIDGEKVEHTKRDISAGLRPYGLSISRRGDVALVANVGRGNGDADTVSLIDLTREPFRVVDTLTVGQTPEGVVMAPNGQIAAVVLINGTNKPRASPFHGSSGKVILLRVRGMRLTSIAEAPIGTWSQGAAFSSDSRTLAVGNIMERNIQLFRIDRNRLTEIGRPMAVPGGSATLRTADFPMMEAPAVTRRQKPPAPPARS